jgi:hypothetical protein
MDTRDLISPALSGFASSDVWIFNPLRITNADTQVFRIAASGSELKVAHRTSQRLQTQKGKIGKNSSKDSTCNKLSPNIHFIHFGNK